MNLIYLHTHDTGRYLEPYGYAVPTPRLRELAGQSALFRNNYCCGPTCSPSRSAMLTGMVPHSCGMMGLAHRGFSIDYTKHLAQYLGRNGFETVLCGMQHEAADAGMIGYSRVYIADKAGMENATQWDEANAASAISFLRENHSKPFFLSFGLEHTHRPFTEFDDDLSRKYLRSPDPLPNSPEIRGDMQGFLTSARRADTVLGSVLDEIRRLGLDKDSVIFYTTDHGIAFPFMKCNLYDSGIGTALMIRYPGNPSAGAAKDSLTSHLDVFPTVCDLLGVPKPEWLQGKSLLPILENKSDEVNDRIFAEVTYHASYDPQRAVRTKRYKYIRRFNPEHTVPVLANIDNSPSKEYMLSAGLAEMAIDQEQLFDLDLDPNERQNRVHDGQYTAVRKELSDMLDHFMEETDDPLRKGPVPLPKGAFVNTLACADPESLREEDIFTQET
ncbi:sulfatase family protein [Breznakiella homolactica]|uniref:Sulfatase n=1 Tax=Breznakiella homolactica TaxID=2798577 RepID=A0A7T7XL94_9SPIR|nr:sulfatase [Breznakiella homolactica]QQO08475.1 sulfatase [Breznakiella homolactica]